MDRTDSRFAFVGGCPGTRAVDSRKNWQLRLLATVGLGMLLGNLAAAQSPQYNVGRAPSDAETKAWDISIAPDGAGLPEGSGTALEGQKVYALRCSECHGEKGEGGDAEALVGGRQTLRSPRPVKTVGSYWPYATTVWDYVNRAMPFDRPGMLSTNQVYAVVAYVLSLNGIIDLTDELNKETLPKVKMPNQKSFIPASKLDSAVEPSRPKDRRK